jgi:DNA-binding PadR family transcriptional regulator
VYPSTSTQIRTRPSGKQGGGRQLYRRSGSNAHDRVDHRTPSDTKQAQPYENASFLSRLKAAPDGRTSQRADDPAPLAFASIADTNACGLAHIDVYVYIRNVPRDALANRLVLPLLGLLVERPAHPYELTARLNERYPFLATTRSSVTTLAKSLAEAGLIRPQRSKRVRNRPARTAYALTDTGLNEFRARVTTHLDDAPAASEQFKLGLAYVGILSRTKAAAALRRRVVARREELDAIPVVQPGGIEVHMIEMAYWKAVVEAEIRWLTSFIDRITSGDIEWPLESRKER